MLSRNQFPSICKLCHPLYVSDSYTDRHKVTAAASGTMSASIVSKSGKRTRFKGVKVRRASKRAHTRLTSSQWRIFGKGRVSLLSFMCS